MHNFVVLHVVLQIAFVQPLTHGGVDLGGHRIAAIPGDATPQSGSLTFGASPA